MCEQSFRKAPLFKFPSSHIGINYCIPSHEAVVLDTLAPDLEPVGGRKVDGLGHIVPVVEAGVVGARERDDKLARVLVHPEHSAMIE